MTERPVGSIATAASSPVGSAVQVVGAVIAVRQLGKLSFVVISDGLSEIQCVVGRDLRNVLNHERAPFYACVSGTLRRRPPADARPDVLHGTLEIAADALRIYRGEQPALEHPSDALRFTTLLQSRGFTDLYTLARMFAPAWAELISADGLIAAKHLAYLVGPCRWHVLTADRIYFGVTPGFIADLKAALYDHDSDGGAIREMLDRAVWDEEQADPDPADAPRAVGSVAVSGSSAPHIASDRYWRKRHSVAHLSDEIVSAAAGDVNIDDVAAQTVEERLARSEAVLQTISGSAGAVMALRDFPEFDLHARHMERMLELFPSLQRRLAHCTGEQQFELLWSLLGHDHVKAIFASPSDVERLSACIEAGLFPDYNVLRHLDGAALRSICVLTSDFRRTEAVKVIGELFETVPGVSASACHLMERTARYGVEWQRCAAVAKRGVISPLAFVAAARAEASPDDIALWRGALASHLSPLFANDPVDEEMCRSALTVIGLRFPWTEAAVHLCHDDDLTFDLVNLTFGPGLLPYHEAGRIYSATEDCSHHWALANINFGGARWNGAQGRFELSDLHLYPSKNRAAILAKSCSGICSARDVALFHRPDHLQFTAVDPAGPTAAGSVQLYLHHDEHGRAIWVVRGINPSEKVAVAPVGFTIEVLDTLSSLARHNGVSALVHADGAGLFNADSARVGIRTVIRRLSGSAKRISFDSPLQLFDYHDRPIAVDFGWQVWP